VGTGEVTEAVADAGPLVHLAEIGTLPLLGICEILHLPDAVWLETIGRGRVSEADLLNACVIRRHSTSSSDVARFVEEHRLAELHSGEQECLYVCRQLGATVLLTDDLAVRDAALRLNLRPVGSLGIVVRAYRQERLSRVEAERHIEDLYTISSLFVTRAIAELAIEQLRQYSGA